MLQFIITLCITILAIASSSIGIQYYNKCTKIQGDSGMKRNRTFLIVILFFAVLGAVVNMGWEVFKLMNPEAAML